MHHHGGIGLKMTQYNIEKEKNVPFIANIILQATFLFLFLFLIFQSNVVFHISIVKAINYARKTTIKEFSHMGSSKENNTNDMGGGGFSFSN